MISSASTVLAEAPDDDRRRALSQMLQRSVESLRVLLTDLLDLSRLEAGEERRNLSHFDAAALLREYCDSVRPLAIERNLFLKAEGPQTLSVQGDPVKIQRIAQNLILNALNVTRRGGVRVSWEERSVSGIVQWLLCVQDTGPGFQRDSPAAPLEKVLREATEEAHAADALAGHSSQPAPAPTLRSQSEPGTTSTSSGEGIGLSIVKRLCELLDASLELETSPGKGSTFRVVLPRAYPRP
jgi:signal transduction histidine kinase